VSRDPNLDQAAVPQSELENCRASRGVAQKQDIAHSSSCEPRDPRNAGSVRHHPDQPHWLELAEERLVDLERRIALVGKLVWGLCGGAVLGAIAGARLGDTALGFALGGLIGPTLARLWHAVAHR
jgi:hypothetical protein